MGNAAVALAKSVCINNKVPWRDDWSVSAKFRPGEKKNRNGWSWYDKRWKTQVMMLTHGSGKRYTVEIAHQPGDISKGWRVDALAHELCHVALIRAEKNYRHDRRLHGKIFGWRTDAVGHK